MAKKSNILEKAQNFVRQNKLGKAISEYEKVAQIDPNDLISSNILGDLYVRHGQKGKALSVFESIAASYVKEGVVLKAIAVYKKIIRLAPGESSEPYVQLAALYKSQRLMGEAIENLKFVLKYQKDNNKNKDAIETIKNILEIKPGLIRLRRELSDIYAKLGNASEARNELIIVASDLAKQKRDSEAEVILNGILQEEPENLTVMLSLSKIFHSRGKVDEAFDILQEVLTIDASNEEALVSFSDILIKKGDVEKGREYLKTLLEIHSKNTAGKLLYARSCLNIGDTTGAGKEYFKLAELYLANKDFEQCIETMQEFLLEQPDSIIAHEQMLDFYNKMDKEEESSCEYKKIADIYARQSKFNKAENVLSKLVQNNPSDIKIRELLKEYSEKANNEDSYDKVETPSFDDNEEISVEAELTGAEIDDVDFGDISFELGGAEDVEEPASLEPSNSEPSEIDFGDISFELDGAEDVEEPASLEPTNSEPSEIDFSDISFELDGAGDVEEPASIEPSNSEPSEIDFSDISFELGGAEDVEEPASLEPTNSEPSEIDFSDISFELDGVGDVEEPASLEPAKSELSDVDFSDISFDSADKKPDIPPSDNSGMDGFIDHTPSDKDLDNSKFSVLDVSVEDLALQGELIDVGKEICEDIEKEEASKKPKLPSYDVNDIFDEFKKGVSKNIDSDDYETHYDLGIAYKEMGLWEDARKEFDISKESHDFQLESHEMIADTFLAAGDVDSAISNLKNGLICKAYTKEKGVAILYRLGCLYEGISKYNEARDIFLKVNAISSNFEDIKERLAKLDSIISSDSDNGQDDTELFDPSTILDD